MRAAAAQAHRMVVIPAIRVVVLFVLFVLLRPVLAPLVPVSVTVLIALAALGIGGWASVHPFGFPGAGQQHSAVRLPRLLVALGADYTIFLVTRARGMTLPGMGQPRGHRGGGVSAIGGRHQQRAGASGAGRGRGGCSRGMRWGCSSIVLSGRSSCVGLGILQGPAFLVRTATVPALFTLIGPRISTPVGARRTRANASAVGLTDCCDQAGTAACAGRGGRVKAILAVLAEPADDRR